MQLKLNWSFLISDVVSFEGVNGTNRNVPVLNYFSYFVKDIDQRVSEWLLPKGKKIKESLLLMTL